ncbi:hypothetical protein A9Q99_26550 [Gammaproteobacteria bacterium 45_16_T64]|nr:hypothetical protein A9Q99_26550 [Gammaproteobacteria bacterium 45_16_T64]
MMLIDAAQRLEALDCRHSYIVQAPAGSGKTGVLSQRILGLLALVERPEEVVAITFTKKAAGEMRQRVLESIHEAKNSPCPESDYEAQTWHLCQAVLKRDTEQNWNLLKHPNRLKIQTIDGFCGSLVKQMPYESNMGSMPSIEDDASVVYENAAKQLINSLGDGFFYDEALGRLLQHVDNNYRLATNLISQMLEKRDHWLEDIVSAKLQGDELKLSLENTLQETVDLQLKELIASVSEDIVREMSTLALYAAQNLAFDNVESPLNAALGFEEDAEFIQTAAAWSAISELLLTKGKPDYRKRVDAKLGFPAPSSSKDPAEKALRKTKKDDVSNLIGKLEEHCPGFNDRLHAIKSLPASGYSDEQWALLVDLLELMPVAVGYLALTWQESGKVDFTEISMSALRALGTSEEPTDLALKYDNRISHLLVDEFQDTSVLQIKLLEKLTFGWQENDGRTLFLVGDPMQGIYSFRKADIGLFLDVWHRHALGDVTLKSLKLETNFRSDEKVIHWVNDVFKSSFPALDNSRDGAVSYSPSTAAKQGNLGAGVTVKVFQEELLDSGEAATEELEFADQESIYIAESIEKLRSDKLTCDKSIAVLVRSKSHAKTVIEQLDRMSIAYRAVDINTLQDSEVIQHLFGITRALLKPSDRIGWYSVLRGPWAGIRLETLVSLHNHNENRSLWDNITAFLDEEPTIELDGIASRDRRVLKQIASLFTYYYDNRKQFALRDAVETMWKNLGGSLVCLSQRTLDDAEKYFELLEGFEKAGDLPNFSVLEKKALTLFASPGSTIDNAVQIMSMHKSKGLEFDYVFIPYSAKRGRSDDRPLLIVDSELIPGEERQKLFLAALPEKGSVNSGDAVYEYLWRNHSEKLKNELCRLTYVACTRAKNRLYITGTLSSDKKGNCKPPSAGSILGTLWTGIEKGSKLGQTQIVEAESVPEIAGHALKVLHEGILDQLTPFQQKIPEKIPVNFNNLQNSAQKVEQEDTLSSSQKSHDFHANVGTFAHRLYKKFADFKGIKLHADKVSALHPSWKAALLRLGVPGKEVNDAVAIVDSAIRHLISYPERATWLFDQSKDSYAEHALTTMEANGEAKNIIIDRTFEDAQGIRWIIDYKFVLPDAESSADVFLQIQRKKYRDQLDFYAQVMNKEKVLGTCLMLYFPLTNQYICWSDDLANITPFE